MMTNKFNNDVNEMLKVMNTREHKQSDFDDAELSMGRFPIEFMNGDNAFWCWYEAPSSIGESGMAEYAEHKYGKNADRLKFDYTHGIRRENALLAKDVFEFHANVNIDCDELTDDEASLLIANAHHETKISRNKLKLINLIVTTDKYDNFTLRELANVELTERPTLTPTQFVAMYAVIFNSLDSEEEQGPREFGLPERTAKLEAKLTVADVRRKLYSNQEFSEQYSLAHFFAAYKFAKEVKQLTDAQIKEIDDTMGIVQYFFKEGRVNKKGRNSGFYALRFLGQKFSNVNFPMGSLTNALDWIIIDSVFAHDMKDWAVEKFNEAFKSFNKDIRKWEITPDEIREIVGQPR